MTTSVPLLIYLPLGGRAATLKRTSHNTYPMTQPQATVQIPVIAQPKVVADDDRGKIEQIETGGPVSVLRITSKKGAVRANHYHQHDFHYCYLESGKIRYVERAIDDEAAPLTEWIVKPGQVFYTRPMIAHAMEFLEDSVFYAFTPRSGQQAEYENDVVRLTLIDPADAARRARRGSSSGATRRARGSS